MSKTLVSALSAISLALSSLAIAQGPYGRGGPDDHRGGMQDDYRQGQQGDRRDDNRRGPHDDHRGEHRGWDQRPDYRANDRGAGPEHRFHRGDRLPPEYRHRQYVVDDWRDYNLRQPPRGYHWVQSGNDYLLIAITSGIIAEIILGR